jgi:hypothetical protein
MKKNFPHSDRWVICNDDDEMYYKGGSDPDDLFTSKEEEAMIFSFSWEAAERKTFLQKEMACELSYCDLEPSATWAAGFNTGLLTAYNYFVDISDDIIRAKSDISNLLIK